MPSTNQALLAVAERRPHPGQRPVVRLACLALLLAAWPLPAQSAPRTPLIEYRNAHWFDGTRFVRASRWVRGDRFVAAGRRADTIVDLGGRWMVPPYADAHTHSPDAPDNVSAIRRLYLTAGVFYVQALTNSRAGRLLIADSVNTPHSLDVVYADGAVTASGGHPQVLYESLGLFQQFANTPERRLQAARSRDREGEVYHTLDRLEQLPSLVERLRREPAPLLKIMLLSSHRSRPIMLDTATAGTFGLDPHVVRPLVDSAHAMGRRVWAHVETVTDLELALDAGVDGLAHLPGYDAATTPDSLLAHYRMTPALARRIARAGMVVGPTSGLAHGAAQLDTAAQRRVRTVFDENIRLLARSGVRLVTGSDTYANAELITQDAIALNDALGGGALGLLRLRSVHTPRAIFPERRLGALAPGFEASFLGLTCNPLRRTACLLSIVDRVKQGASVVP